MKTWTDAELSYLAGIIDGEGTITVFHPKSRPATVFEQIVTVETTSKILTDWLVIHFGGQVYFRERPINLPQGIQSKRSRWKWTLRKSEIDNIVPAILPFLVIKHEQAELMIEFRALMSLNGVWAKRGVPAANLSRRLEIAHRFSLINLTRIKS
jgi:hypothetical protein